MRKVTVVSDMVILRVLELYVFFFNISTKKIDLC